MEEAWKICSLPWEACNVLETRAGTSGPGTVFRQVFVPEDRSVIDRHPSACTDRGRHTIMLQSHGRPNIVIHGSNMIATLRIQRLVS